MMVKRTKTDNHNLAAKLLLRRDFLDRWHSGEKEGEPISVLDCCEGEGKIWDTLERSYNCWRWGIDLKPEEGRLSLDSRVVLTFDIDYDVIDIDTYGSPWEHWTNLIQHVRRPTTVFLTYCLMTGSMGKPIGGVPKGVIRGLGLDFPTLELPAIMANKLFAIVPLRMIALAWEQGLRVIEIKEALYGKQGRGRARYFGVRIEPDGIEGAAT